ncbi:MAG: membrane protein insertase YidC, partial [Rickettsiales bacterium]|nr:membrane protein insertase YidC [Rickettsiales bacterium]
MVQYLDNKNSGFNQFKASADASKAPSKFSGIFWWIILFLASWWLISSWLAPSKSEVRRAESEAPVETVIKAPVQQLESTDISAKVQGLRILDISLNAYQKEYGGEESIRLLSGANEFAEVGLLANGTAGPTTNTEWKAARAAGSNSMSWRNSDGIEFVRVITIDSYTISIKDTVKNNSGKDVALAPYVRIVRGQGESSAGVSTGAVALTQGGIEKNSWRDLEKKSYAYETKSGGFVGFQDQYWETVAAAPGGDQTIRMKQLDSGMFQSDISSSMTTIQPGKTYSFETQVFA